MSKFGFDKIIAGLGRIEHDFLSSAMKESQKEFQRNFQTESNSETVQPWQSVKRPVPPPILVETGSLKGEATRQGRVVISKGKAVLTVDPSDKRGRFYADYHQSGIGRNAKREFITHSRALTEKHVSILVGLLDKEFK